MIAMYLSLRITVVGLMVNYWLPRDLSSGAAAVDAARGT